MSAHRRAKNAEFRFPMRRTAGGCITNETSACQDIAIDDPAGREAGGRRGLVVKAVEHVRQVTCLQCRHKIILKYQPLASFGIKAEIARRMRA
jgi:DNA-directed RNA polymerase subunit RPC12/RpoP